jgi:hypothetical protein
MAGRNFETIESANLLELKEVLEAYAKYCEETAVLIDGKTIYTDGYKTVKKGLFALRNLLGKQLGQIAVSHPEVVATWDYRKKKTVVPIRLNAAESPPIYDLSQGNPSMKAQAKAVKKLIPDAKLKRKKSGKD